MSTDDQAGDDPSSRDTLGTPGDGGVDTSTAPGPRDDAATRPTGGSTAGPTAGPTAGSPGHEQPGDEADATPAVTASSDTEPVPRPWWQEGLLLLALTVILAMVVKTFLVQAFYIPSESMEPALERDDRILVQKVSYWFSGAPERGDVVVFEDPGDWLGPDEQPGPRNVLTRSLSAIGIYPGSGYLVKRVIGVEGDTIECCDSEGRILVNGVELEESDYARLEDVPCAGPMTGQCQWTAGPVPEGRVFVMGDNRGASGDSTGHLCTALETDCTADPYIDVSLVVGKVAAVVWPFDRFAGVENSPASFDPVDEADKALAGR